MANTFELIASYTAGGTVSTIDFTSIPATYTDLVLKVSARSSYAGIQASLYVSPNGSGANGSSRILFGSGSSAASYNYTNINVRDIAANTSTASTFGNTEIYIPNYAGASYKSMSADSVGENNATAAPAGLTAGLWSQTAAISSLSLSTDGSFLANSTAYLYGVKNA